MTVRLTYTRDDALAARDELRTEVLADFPMGPEGISTSIAAMVSCAARPAVGTTPAIIVDATTAGSGKTLLAEIIAMIGTGEVISPIGFRPDPAEFAKTFVATLQEGRGAMVIDNISADFGSSEFDACTTSRSGRMRVRLLGRSETIEVSTETVIFATGNGVSLKGDAGRRVLWITLDPKMEDPETRTGFRHEDLYSWVRQNLERLHGLVLVMWEAFRQAGRPRSGQPLLGSFEVWSAQVRDLCLWLDLSDPTATRTKSLERDPDREFLAAILPALERLDPQCEGIYVAQLVSAAQLSKNADLAAALTDFTTPGKGVNAKALGKRLKTFQGRIVGGRRLVSKMAHGQRRWSAEKVT